MRRYNGALRDTGGTESALVKPDLSRRPLTMAHRRIAREVLTQGPVSRSELARRLGLSRASLTRLTKPLLEDGLFVEEQTQREARTGRPVRPLDIAASHRHFIGINLTGHDLAAVVTTFRAEIVESTYTPLRGSDPVAVVDSIREVATSLRRDAGNVGGLGLSLGGHVRDHHVVTRAPFLGWTDDVPLGPLVDSATGLPTVVDNDLQALTRAQHWFGAGQDSEHFAVLTIGAGVGCGLVIHDQVVESADAGIGLVGHYPLDPLGPLCVDGHRGCANAMLTTVSLCARTSAAVHRDVTYDEFLALTAGGHPAAVTIATDAGLALGRLIAAVANITMTQRIILTGEGIGLVEIIREHVDRSIDRDRDPAATRLDLVVQPSDFTEWARGAAVIAIQTHVLGRS
jgi:predicted NBD/HSP70 family sugar kinase